MDTPSEKSKNVKDITLQKTKKPLLSTKAWFEKFRVHLKNIIKEHFWIEACLLLSFVLQTFLIE